MPLSSSSTPASLSLIRFPILHRHRDRGWWCDDEVFRARPEHEVHACAVNFTASPSKGDGAPVRYETSTPCAALLASRSYSPTPARLCAAHSSLAGSSTIADRRRRTATGGARGA